MSDGHRLSNYCPGRCVIGVREEAIALRSGCSKYLIIIELSVVVCINSEFDSRGEAVVAVRTSQGYCKYDVAVSARLQ